MKVSFTSKREFPKFWLLVLGGCLIAIDLSLIWKAGLSNLLATSIFFGAALFYQLRKKADTLSLESKIYDKLLGLFIIAFLLLNTPFLPNYDFSIRLLPFISALSIALIASGISKLKQYWQELLLLSILAIPLERLIHPVDEIFGVATLLAKIATFMLWYVGFEVTRQGDLIILPMKASWVSPNCSGTLTILWMLQLAVLVLVIFPTKFIQKILLPLAAVFIVVSVNGIRISILAALAAYNYEAYEYWHLDKHQIFSTIHILIFGLFCRWLIRRNSRLNLN